MIGRAPALSFALAWACTLFASPALADENAYLPNPTYSEALAGAARAGDAAAQFQVAAAFYLGAGVVKDQKAALHWARMSAEAGVLHAACIAGDLLYEAGDPKALAYLRAGASAGYGKCQELLASIADEGWEQADVAADSPLASRIYTLCAKGGRASCQLETGRRLLAAAVAARGAGERARLINLAAGWLQLACERPENITSMQAEALVSMSWRLRRSAAPPSQHHSL